MLSASATITICDECLICVIFRPSAGLFSPLDSGVPVLGFHPTYDTNGVAPSPAESVLPGHCVKALKATRMFSAYQLHTAYSGCPSRRGKFAGFVPCPSTKYPSLCRSSVGQLAPLEYGLALASFTS